MNILGSKRTVTGPLTSWGSRYKAAYSSMNVRVDHDYLLDLESKQSEFGMDVAVSSILTRNMNDVGEGYGKLFLLTESSVK